MAIQLGFPRWYVTAPVFLVAKLDAGKWGFFFDRVGFVGYTTAIADAVHYQTRESAQTFVDELRLDDNYAQGSALIQVVEYDALRHRQCHDCRGVYARDTIAYREDLAGFVRGYCAACRTKGVEDSVAWEAKRAARRALRAT